MDDLKGKPTSVLMCPCWKKKTEAVTWHDVLWQPMRTEALRPREDDRGKPTGQSASDGFRTRRKAGGIVTHPPGSAGVSWPILDDKALRKPCLWPTRLSILGSWAFSPTPEEENQLWPHLLRPSGRVLAVSVRISILLSTVSGPLLLEEQKMDCHS